MPPSVSRASTRSGRPRGRPRKDQAQEALQAPERTPPPKRQKREHPGFATPSKLTSTMSASTVQSQPLSAGRAGPRPEGMYHFGPKAGENVIDLTGAASSPQRPSSLSSAPRGPSSNGSIIPIRQTGLNGLSGYSIGARKLVVKNFRGSTPRTPPDEYYKAMWAQLSAALDLIFARSAAQQGGWDFCFEELYRGVENICRQGLGERLFKELEARCRERVETTVRRALECAVKNSDDRKGTALLRSATDLWETWNKQISTIRLIFCFLNQSYLVKSTNRPQLDELGVQLFRDCTFVNPMLKDKTVRAACDLLSSDREDEDTDMHGKFDPALFRKAVEMFHNLGVYTKFFEPALLSISRPYFSKWAKAKVRSLNLGPYVESCIALLNREITRCEVFMLDDSTRRSLVKQIEDSLIEGQAARLVNPSDVAELMKENKIDTLRDLYQLLERKSLGVRLRPAFESYIQNTGSLIVFDENRESEMVVRLIQFKSKLENILEQSFAKKKELGYSQKESFEAFMNKTQKTAMTWGTDNDKPGEMIAKYVDQILRGGVKAIPQSAFPEGPATAATQDDEGEEGEPDPDVQINSQLDQVLDLFRFLHGKSVFEAFYKRDLAKRLLMGRSASADAEKSMLTRLRSECGTGFTHNLEQMFKDIELAREENLEYQSLIEARGKKYPIDLNVNVLSAAAWPTYPSIEVIIPTQISSISQRFEEHYIAQHRGRKLEWKHSLAHCQMKAYFPRGTKELVVSSFQAAVLLCFADPTQTSPMGYADIEGATKLFGDELKRTLQSLACARYRVLLKSPRGRNINTTDRFMLNEKFEDAKYRIKINQIQLRETREENRRTHERVAADRQYETQAAIVRIMKREKKIKHAPLIAEVINVTKNRGSVNADDIKKQIEKLIDKDYMERAEDGFYEYIS